MKDVSVIVRQIPVIKSLIAVALVIVVSVVVSALLSSGRAYAYTCDYSNNGGNSYTSSMGYTGQLQYKGGSCILMKPDTANGGVKPNSTGACPSDKSIAWEGQCYQPRAEYTNLKPTNQDGSAVSNADWEALCSQSDYSKYNGSRHRCENDGFVGEGSCALVAWDSDSIDGDCEAPGNGNAKSLDSIKQDGTAAKVNECKNAGLGINPSTHECNWTEEKCPQKNGGQGKWIDGQCKAYSDYTTKETCEDPKVGGQFKQDSSDASHWECVKPGTDVKPQDPEDAPAEGVDGTKDTTVKEKCGNARTNLIACDGTGAVALNGVLKIVISVLTVLVGIAAVGGLAWASILYAKATDNQSNVSEARTLIQEIVIGLVLYVLLLAIVNFLVPGGLF